MSNCTIDCQVTLLTPAGRGAVATISIVGQQAMAVVERCFKPLGCRRLSAVPIGELVIGHWHNETGQREEIVAARIHATRVDIHCHGGLAASDALIKTVVDAGATRVDPQSWVQSQVQDPIQSAAWQAISQARTHRATAILLDQWRGALREAIQQVADLLESPSPAIGSAVERVERLIDLGDCGLHLTQPWQVVLAGLPNVGKSSLMNALLGYERCIVFDQPGTTRDVLSANTAIDGWALELFDTAGYRDSTDSIEREGSLRAWRQIKEADLTVIVVDATKTESLDVRVFQEAARTSLVVANKVDLCATTDHIPRGFLCTSAVDGSGIEELAFAIMQKLVPYSPRKKEAVPFTAEQLQALQRARSALAVRDVAACKGALSPVIGFCHD